MNRRIPFFIAVCILGAAVVGAWLYNPRPANPLHELAGAHLKRAFVPRFSIQMKYRACTPLSAQGDETVPREGCGTNEEGALDANAFDTDADGTNADALRASALAKLIWGEEAGPPLDDAISLLSRASTLTRRSVPVLVDLAGTHLVRAERTQNPRDLAQALEYALEALETEPKNQAALFDAALALQSITIDGQAATMWDRYLAVDSTSPWASDARRRKSILPKPRPEPTPPSVSSSPAEVYAYAAQYPQEARLRGWQQELGGWGKAVISGDAVSAARHLELAERLGSALERRRGGDATLADAVHAIRAAAADPAAMRVLARGHRDYANGRASDDKDETEQALRAFTHVINSTAPSPDLIAWAEAERAGMLVNLSDPRAYPALDTLILHADTLRQPALAARLRWVRATGLLRDGRYPEARTDYEIAGRIFERLGETEFAGAVVGLAGETAYEEGDTLAAYLSLHRSLLKLRTYGNSIWLHGRLFELAHVAARDRMPQAALLIEHEDVSASLGSDVPSTRMEALLGLVNLRADAGEVHGADQDLEAAAQLLNGMNDKTTHARFVADLQVARARISPASERSVLSLDSAVRFFSKRNVVRFLPVLMLRTDARLAIGDIAGATADLDTATARIRGVSLNEVRASDRVSMIEEARSRFDQLVMLHVNRGRIPEALKALERGRVSFVPSDSARDTVHRDLAAPHGQVALEYALIGDTLLTWTIRERDVNLNRRRLDRGEFLRVVRRVGAGLETRAGLAAIRPDLERLYDVLIRPVEHLLGGPDTPLVILADGEVAGVPFAAVYDRSHGRYLVEDHSLRFASSLADASRPAPARTGEDTALLIADPAFDALHSPELPRLRGARAEVEALRALYPNPRNVVLSGTGATRAAVAADAQRATVIHYAGHAVFNDAVPERSYLVLAGSGVSGELSADEISKMKLRRLRLVVLSACRTQPSRGGRSGGFAGLSGALLAAGAGGVVGSVWDVDDSLAQPLMLAFHRKYLHSGNAAEALREAQLTLLHSHEPTLQSPVAWAGFRYAGR
jgi:CHAT domain-containing protein/tetratricopeptide (TPR) repeat protein